MKVSVIIPTYGKPIYLKKAIASVINQTFKDWELIIVDDNNPGTDARKNTESIVGSFLGIDDRIKYIKHDSNKNGAVARNTGFAIASGKYISLLDSDDEYMPSRLEKCVGIMEVATDSIAGVYTGCEFRRANKTYNKYTNVKAGNYLVETLACSFMLCTGSNIFIRKDIVDELNGFDSTFLRQQDYEFLVRVFQKYSLEAIPELLVVKNNENFNLPEVTKQIEIRKQYLNKYNYIIEHLSEDKKNYIYHHNCINIAENALLQMQFKIANEYYKKSKFYTTMSIKESFRKTVLSVYALIRKICMK